MKLWAVFAVVVLGVGGTPPTPAGGRPNEGWAAAPEVLGDWRAHDGLTGGRTYEEAVGGILVELGTPAGLAGRFEELRGRGGAESDWAALYVDACDARRRARLEPGLGSWGRVVFTKHYDLGGSHYAYTEGLSDAQNERHFTPGSALCALAMDGVYGRVETLLEDAGGVIRDPDVSLDGERVLFSWKKSLDGDDYHLYEMDLGDRSVRQLTSGLGHADYEGQYLPDGDIVFSSSRCVQIVDCWWTEVSNLYRCGADGRYLRRLGFDQVHTNYPTVTPDGRVLYTRWEYSDRGQIFPQALFQMRPDGTGQTEFYGNNSYFPTTIMHARAIPGSRKVVAVFSGHHCKQHGWLGLIDPALGRQENSGAQLIAPVRPTEAARIDAYGQQGDQFQYPYPLSEREFLVAFQPAGAAHFALYWVDIEGRRELLAWDAGVSCNQPVPLVARRAPHETASVVDYRKDSGVFYVQDVYHGPGLAGVERGVVKKLRVVALDYRAAGIGNNVNEGPAGAALVSTPVSIQGAWDVKTVLGTANVYGDGSACFTAPARRAVYFQALDANNRAVQTMRSWATLQPGETASCAGCHEHKNSAPPVGKVTEAMRAGPQALEPEGPARGFSFQREIQPILDRHCVRCHYLDVPERRVAPGGSRDEDKTLVAAPAPAAKTPRPDGKPAAFSLEGAAGAWSPAYRALANRAVNDWIDPQSGPPMLEPYAAGSAKSPLVRMLEQGHQGAKLLREEMDRIACWIDLLVPCFGDYTEGLSGEGLETYNHFLDKRREQEAFERENIRALIGSRN